MYIVASSAAHRRIPLAVKVRIKMNICSSSKMVVVQVSQVWIIIISGVIGSAVPLALKKLNIDPALAAGPFVTTSNDILSLLIYLGLVTIFLRMPA